MGIAEKEESGFVVLSLIGRFNGVSAGNVEKIIASKRERRWFQKTEMNYRDPTNTEIVNNEILAEVIL